MFEITVSKNMKNEIYRKAIHISSLWMPLFIYLAPQEWTLFLFGGGFILNTMIEYANYRRYKWASKSFGRLFFRTLRAKETVRDKFRPTGSMYVLAAAFLCSLLFSKPIAAISLTVMLTADAAAALIGKFYGKRKIYKKKTLEGTTAFFACALLINMLFNPLSTFTYAGVLACLAATFSELFEDKIKIDDNLSVPLLSGLILTIL